MCMRCVTTKPARSANGVTRFLPRREAALPLPFHTGLGRLTHRLSPITEKAWFTLRCIATPPERPGSVRNVAKRSAVRSQDARRGGYTLKTNVIMKKMFRIKYKVGAAVYYYVLEAEDAALAEQAMIRRLNAFYGRNLLFSNLGYDVELKVLDVQTW